MLIFLSQLRVSWSCTLIGLVALLFAPCPFLFYVYGAKIREKSQFAPCVVRAPLFSLVRHCHQKYVM